MSTILDVLEGKGSDVFCIDPSATVFQAVGCMVEHNVGSLLVTDGARQDSAPCMRGIITERDYLKKVVLRGKTSRNTAVAEIMSPLRRVARPGDSVDTCLAIMTIERIRHLPVIQGNRIAGIVSIGDLTKLKLAEQRTEIEHIVGYMQGVPTPVTFGSICYGRSESTRRHRWSSNGSHDALDARSERWNSR